MGGPRRLRRGGGGPLSRRAAWAALPFAVVLAAGAFLLGTSRSALPEPERPALRLEVVAGGLQFPVDLAAASGEPDRLYVAEQTGTIRVVRAGAVEREPFLDLTPVVGVGGERGLLGLAFHPGYERNRRFYVHYTDRAGDTRVVEYRSRGGRALPRSGPPLLAVSQPYGNHNGGQIAFGPDGRLYLGLRDGGASYDPRGSAQDLTSLLGKLLRLDVDRPGARPEIAAYGLRNPWRFAFDGEGNVFTPTWARTAGRR